MKKNWKDKILRFLIRLRCFCGLHRVEKTWGLYHLGKCEDCGYEDMFF